MAVIRSAYDDQRVKVLVETGKSMTKQAHKDECDINRIMAKYQKTGVITHVAKYAMEYGDATDIDYQTALNTVIEAQRMFADLPSSVRRKFDEDPAEFLAFVQNPENVEEMRELGLVDVPEDPIPIPVVMAANPVPEPAPVDEPAPAG